MHDWLFEIGCEEIPARFLQRVKQELKQSLVEWLEVRRISFDTFETFATPRRVTGMFKFRL